MGSPMLAAFGNPLLDIIVRDGCEALVDRYGLARGIQQEMDTVASGLYAEVIQRQDLEYSGGGCALNTVRVFQWLHSSSSRCPGPQAVFFGSLGKDTGGHRIQSIVSGDGVRGGFARQTDLPTGHCIALVEGVERTLVANLGAANRYSVSDLWAGDNPALLQGCKVIYVEGFFLSHSPQAVMELARFAQEKNIAFVFNLCGEYVCEDTGYVENVLAILPFIDILFGNRSEFEVFLDTVEVKLKSWSTVMGPVVRAHTHTLVRAMHTAILRRTETQPHTDNIDPDPHTQIHARGQSPVRKKPRHLLCVVTEGCSPVDCYSIGDDTLTKMSVPVAKLPTHSVQDTIGAGDSFIAGFLFLFLRDSCVRVCVEGGIWTAQTMIQQVGVTLPGVTNQLPALFSGRKAIKRTSSCSQDSVSSPPRIESELAKIRS